MAFVEVIRRSMRPEEWTDLRYSWIKRSLIKEKYEITDLEIRDAFQTAENEYTYTSDYRPLKTGDMYFSPDGTAFIRGHAQIPESLKEKDIWFTLHTAAEMIVKINGHYAGGIDPNRDRILVNPWLNKDSAELTIEIEGYNRSKPGMTSEIPMPSPAGAAARSLKALIWQSSMSRSYPCFTI